jgi:hypothetical protein
MSKGTQRLSVVLVCKRGTEKFAEYPAVEVIERIHKVVSPLGAVVGVSNGGGTAIVRVSCDSANAVLAAVATVPGVLSAELVMAEAAAGALSAGNRGRARGDETLVEVDHGGDSLSSHVEKPARN